MNKRQTFADLLNEFCNRARTRGCEPATVKGYRYAADRFLIPALGGRWVHTLKPEDFDRLAVTMTEHGFVPSTTRKTIGCAGGALHLAHRRGWIVSNPARLAETPRGYRPIRFIPTPDEVNVFLDEAQQRDLLIHDYSWILANSGMRPGEGCGLQHADLEGSTLTIQRSIDVCQGGARIKSTKTGKTRRITLDPVTIGVINRRPGPWVVGGDRPARTDLMSKRVKRVAHHCDSKITPRCFRHYHATQLLGARVPPKAVADRLGHANPIMTLNVYAGHVPALDVEAASVIAGVMAR